MAQATVLKPGQYRHPLTLATGRCPERDVLVLLMGIHMGMRVSEITQVEVADFMFRPVRSGKNQPPGFGQQGREAAHRVRHQSPPDRGAGRLAGLADRQTLAHDEKVYGRREFRFKLADNTYAEYTFEADE
jgi:integrase